MPKSAFGVDLAHAALIWLNHAEYQKRIPPKGIHSVDLWVSLRSTQPAIFNLIIKLTLK